MRLPPLPRPSRERRVKIGALLMRSKTRNLVDDEERRRDRPLRKAKEERRLHRLNAASNLLILRLKIFTSRRYGMLALRRGIG
jgi:hypothetical protein